MVWQQWIEWLTGAAPDGGDGALESVLVIGLALLAVGTGLDVLVGWLRSRRSTSEVPEG